MDEIAQLINNVGFNAAFLCIMAYFLKYVFDRLQNTIDNFSVNIAENTKILTKLCEKLENENEKGE